jgi:hypothetical protein
MTPAQMRRLAPAVIVFVVFFLIGNAIANSLFWGLVLAVIAFALTPRVLEWAARPGGPLDSLAKQAATRAQMAQTTPPPASSAAAEPKPDQPGPSA